MNSSLQLQTPFSRAKDMPCRVSDPTTHPHSLRVRLGILLPHSACFACGKRDPPNSVNHHFYCPTCDLQFHYYCHLFPRIIRHPYHLQHPLTFTYSESGTLVYDGNIGETPRGMSEYEHTHGQCDWCGEHLRMYFYRCSICTFSLDTSCCMKYPLLTIANPKSHHHALTLLPRPLSVPCDACGVADARDPAYACLQCNYVVHQSCDGLPRVIKITRHPHRLALTLSLPHEKLSCRICHRKVEVKYGAYSCLEGCPCFFHSKCATRSQIWDGKELEWVPEEPDAIEDIEPFKKIGDKEILHFSHKNHHLRLNHEGVIHDPSKQCRACILPVDSGDFYSCLQCDFFLHATCASLPRKKDHALHRHPLILDPLPPHEYETMCCSACRRMSSGFIYKCAYRNCGTFRLDVRCASLSEVLVHKSHQHSLFIDTAFDSSRSLLCGICRQRCSIRYRLKCIDECGFFMCFGCATLPNEVRYKYDEHPLYLCCGEDASDSYWWCEVCEKKLDPEKSFYTCDRCCVTLHVECVFGSSVLLMPGRSMKYLDSEVEIVRNNSSTRPVCRECGKRCPDIVLFRLMNYDYLCSLGCLRFHIIFSEKNKVSGA